MQQKIVLRLLPQEAADDSIIRSYIAQSAAQPVSAITGFYRLKQSIDARSKQVWINLTVQACINEPFIDRPEMPITYKDVSQSKHKVIVIGAGPAGLYAALRLIESGIKPIVLERGKDVRARRRDLAQLNKEGIVNPESNYCFGEGGAGTYSDGKLYTRSNKRGSIDKVLHIFTRFGADDSILYDAHPHIGTNKLPQIITAMREQIVASGGDFHFEQKVDGFTIHNNTITGVTTQQGASFHGDAVILATGHSARDIFELLHRNNILIEAKPFALGVRAEHPQSIIDSAQYHCPIPAFAPKNTIVRPDHLPPASYSLVEQVDGRGVFSFCMCPGGIIAPAATNPKELVVNGWSPSKRNNPTANSGMVVQVEIEDAIKYFKNAKGHSYNSNDPLLMMRFQEDIERKAYQVGGGNFVAPAQRMVDFCNNKIATNLPDCSYVPGVLSSDLRGVLPGFVMRSLQQGFQAFGKKMRGYYTNDAIIVATESRTSSPVRIPRDAETLQHPQISNLYPCAEGAGYAGGIVSAAMDGEKVAAAISVLLTGCL
ncbi:hypothetical protein SAMN05421788_104247 [Filimonas lacunae]|uniref:Uncharacterized protein n=1 Tax=Filimonas lacunae TaxID=477680 RepID=A0A173MRW2_9BACT|nr:FAD-dependent oxidoreductase [Filimonas lacunae]BAV10382.1 NAD(FAD)-utilizing dehydrogenases [Filimonas lacunae]SIT16412.1 hypothetical protein SAMN05421788_104247 [Filimonas lacunae]